MIALALLKRFLPHLVVAAAICVLGWQVYAAGARSVQAKWDAAVVAQVLADDTARLKAQADRDATLIPIIAQRDKAISLLKRLRERVSQPLTMEVQGEGSTCPRLGPAFLELWNAGAETFETMREADRGDDAASPARVRPAPRPAEPRPEDAG